MSNNNPPIQLPSSFYPTSNVSGKTHENPPSVSLKFTIKLRNPNSSCIVLNKCSSQSMAFDSDDYDGGGGGVKGSDQALKKNRLLEKFNDVDDGFKGFMDSDGLKKKGLLKNLDEFEGQKKKKKEWEKTQDFSPNNRLVDYYGGLKRPRIIDKELLMKREMEEEQEKSRERQLLMDAVQGLLLLSQNHPVVSFSPKTPSPAATEKDSFKTSMRQKNAGKGKKKGHEDEDETKDKKRLRKDKKRLQKDVAGVPDLPPRLKTYFDGLLGAGVLATAPVFVIQKALTKTDLSIRHNRLSMPLSSINRLFLENFLTEDEKAMLQQKNRQHIRVNLVDPDLREYCGLNFTRWDMSGSPYYVLVTDWNDVWNDNRLEEGMIIQMWSFRVKQNAISFVLVVQRN